MPTLESHTRISPTMFPEFQTGVDVDAPLMRVQSRDYDARKAWQEAIDTMLFSWLCDPAQLADEDIDAPSGSIIRLAIDLAEKFRDQGLAAPDRVVPDPNGGIVFERRERDISEVFHVWDDGSVEYMRFEGNRLVERSSV